MTTNIEFKYINPELYRHPGETEARKRLEKIPGFNKALDMLSDGAAVKAERQTEIASMVRVGPGVYPVLNTLWNDLQSLFGLSGVPLHIAYGLPQAWALRGGNDHPTVVIDSKSLDALPEREMTALLSMQAGLIRLGNATYLAAADFMRWFMDFYGIAGAPAALPSWGIENWRRYAMFSADRAAALSAGDPEAMAALLARISGAGNSSWGGVSEPDALRIQGIEALSHERDWSNNRLRRFALAMNRQNNVGLIRRLDLLDWFSSGVPARILTGEMTAPESAVSDAGAEADAGVSVDPGLAYWGEFASCDDDCKESGGPVADLREMAERGLNSFWKAGEAFWKTFQDKK